MGLFTGFYRAVAKQIAGEMSITQGRYPMLTKANYKGTDDSTLIEEGYLKNADLYSIVQFDVKKFAAIPVNTYKIKSSEEKSYRKYKKQKHYLGVKTLEFQRKALEEIEENNDVSRLLVKPNPFQGADAFWQSVKGFFNLTGETFIWVSRDNDGKGKPMAMYVLPSQFMTVVGSATNMFEVVSYVFTVSGQEINIPKEDILHWKTWNPEFDLFVREQLRGVSPLRALSRTITASNEANDAMVAMYQNGGAKGVLYNETLSDLSVEQESQLRGVMDRKVNNVKMKAAVASLQGKWGYLDLGMSSVDMQLLESQKVTRKQFADALCVPVDLIEGDKTYANREQAMKDWVSNSIYPAWKSLCDELNRFLIPMFGLDSARIVIDVDISMLPEMQDDQKKLTEIAEKSWWLSFNEKRVLTGNEPEPGKDGVYFIPSGLQTFEQATSEIAMPLNDNQIDDLNKMYEP